MTSGRAALIVGLWLLLGGCRDAGPAEDAAAELPGLSFDSARVQIATGADTIPLRVEIAATGEQRALGLMERTQLPPDAGMLFTYSDVQPAEAGFWMFRTRIPLDIAFLDETGRIAAIRTMEPCTSPYPQWCPTYEAGVPYRAALEVNRGYFAEQGIEVGDRVLLPDLLGSAGGE